MDVWSQQPGEPERAFALFAAYRDLGPLERSLAKVAREHGRAVKHVERLSARHSWTARTAAWDQENERVKRAGQLRELEAMARRQILAGQFLTSRALKRAQTMTDEEVDSMSIWEMLKMLDTGVRLELLGRGFPPTGPIQYPDVIPPREEDGALGVTIELILRRNPSRVGPIIQALAPLEDLLADLDASPEVEQDADLADILGEDQ